MSTKPEKFTQRRLVSVRIAQPLLDNIKRIKKLSGLSLNAIMANGAALEIERLAKLHNIDTSIPVKRAPRVASQGR